MRIALLTHSTNPRGGVIHVLELGRALQARGHAVTVVAPACPGDRFFRATPCQVELASAPGRTAGLAHSVRMRIAALREHVGQLLGRQEFDVLHAHDGIGGNALADLQQQGRIGGFLRTVHHVDRFADAQVQAWQERAIRAAQAVFCVSAIWRERLSAELGIRAEQVANGVDLERFSPAARATDAQVLQRHGICRAGPLVLSLGGVEARKNTRRLLLAFALLRHSLPRAQLVIGGGASLLDHEAEVRAFRADAQRLGLRIGPGAPVVLTGPLADDDVPALYRLADVVAMPSLVEGFGLVALEALASGAPVVVSRIAPFTEHFGADEATWADPQRPESIAEALLRALARGRHHVPPQVCRRYAWSSSAARHESLYRAALKPAPRRAAARVPEHDPI